MRREPCLSNNYAEVVNVLELFPPHVRDRFERLAEAISAFEERTGIIMVRMTVFATSAEELTVLSVDTILMRSTDDSERDGRDGAGGWMSRIAGL